MSMISREASRYDPAWVCLAQATSPLCMCVLPAFADSGTRATGPEAAQMGSLVGAGLFMMMPLDPCRGMGSALQVGADDSASDVPDGPPACHGSDVLSGALLGQSAPDKATELNPPLSSLAGG
jgi:hypothetical protein